MHLKLKNLLLDSSDSDDWNFLENKINLINLINFLWFLINFYKFIHLFSNEISVFFWEVEFYFDYVSDYNLAHIIDHKLIVIKCCLKLSIFHYFILLYLSSH